MTISFKLKSIFSEYRAFHAVKVREEGRGVPLYGPDILGPYIDSYNRLYPFSKLSVPRISSSS